jgi:hypothetical protein
MAPALTSTHHPHPCAVELLNVNSSLCYLAAAACTRHEHVICAHHPHLCAVELLSVNTYS